MKIPGIFKQARIISILLLTATIVTFSYAAENRGWEIGSEYNNLYDLKENDSLKGTVKKFLKVIPLPGMSEGTAFILDDKSGDDILVHLCPVSYASANQVGFRNGDKVKVKGSWAAIDGKDVFMARKVSKGDHFEFKVRLTSDGTPFWTMSAEQLAREKASE